LADHTLLISRDSRETPVADSAAPIRYADGSLSGVVLVFRDATVEREARETNARLAAIVEHSGDVILTKNLEGIIQSWNRGAERLFGYRADEIIGKPVTTLFPADRLTEEDHILGRLRQGQPVERLETVRVAKDGRHIPVLVSISPLKDVDGHVVGASKVIHNMTELALAREKEKQAAESLRQANEKLASHAIQMQELVQQRTAQLTEMIGNLEAFSYSIVHDMRAPLRAMQSFATLLPEECGQVSPKGQDYIRRIQTGAERMDRLIQDGLNYSRLMRADLPLVTTDAVALLRGMIETYPAFQPPNAEIELVGNFPLIWANEAGLTQCVSNLLNNAVKFVAPGTTPRIRIWTETRHGRVRVLFKDNGIGIERSAHEKIFQIFYRLDTKYEGTGIGLAIVKKAVERMGGTVGLESERGQGSTFWLELKSANEKKSAGG
jgi:PAS domain S-box-containing protein